MFKVKNTGNGKQDLADAIKVMFWTIVAVALAVGALIGIGIYTLITWIF